MRIMVLGGDGYPEWPPAVYLSAQSHEVAVLDDAVRRQYDEELGAKSLVPIVSLHERVKAWQEVSGKQIELWFGDLSDADFTDEAVSGLRTLADAAAR